MTKLLKSLTLLIVVVVVLMPLSNARPHHHHKPSTTGAITPRPVILIDDLLEGRIQSSAVKDNETHEWRISFPSHDYVVVKLMLQFSLKNKDDFIKLYDISGSSIGSFDSLATIPETLYSQSSIVSVQAKLTSVKSTFKLRFKYVAKTKCNTIVTLDNGIKTGAIGTVPSNAFGNYFANEVCHWIIPNSFYDFGESMLLELKSMDIEQCGSSTTLCPCDRLQIYDNGYLLAQKCGKMTTNNVDYFIVSGKEARISFLSDQKVEKKGFYMTFRIGNSSNFSTTTVPPLPNNSYYCNYFMGFCTSYNWMFWLLIGSGAFLMLVSCCCFICSCCKKSQTASSIRGARRTATHRRHSSDNIAVISGSDACCDNPPDYALIVGNSSSPDIISTANLVCHESSSSSSSSNSSNVRVVKLFEAYDLPSYDAVVNAVSSSPSLSSSTFNRQDQSDQSDEFAPTTQS